MRRGDLSLSERLLRYLKVKEGQWINGGQMEERAMKAGYKGSTASRELRYLAEWGEDGRRPLIDREEFTNHQMGTRSVSYRWTRDFVPSTACASTWADLSVARSLSERSHIGSLLACWVCA